MEGGGGSGGDPLFIPEGYSTLMLSAARLRHVAGTKWGTRRYLTMELHTQQTERELAIA